MNRLLFVSGLLALLGGCTTTDLPPIRTAERVDLQRFMGDWYVIASIPTLIERDAYNALESYRLLGDGRVATTFSFNEGGFDGKRKTFTPTGFVLDAESNAIWGMRFVWPIKADYRIVYVDKNYRQTIIGRLQRDYVWIMARAPHIPPDDMQRLIAIIAEQGYDTAKLRQVPQHWPDRASTQGDTP
ncbi:MAG: lipocalin family protein [Thiogranum sp.]